MFWKIIGFEMPVLEFVPNFYTLFWIFAENGNPKGWRVPDWSRMEVPLPPVFDPIFPGLFLFKDGKLFLGDLVYCKEVEIKLLQCQ